ncbi:MAG TPA: hypothetical protein VEI54_13080 [Candidatus Limnocylindrales bacterium]|nr:hypothetical protein [Candidatus Limnocylindrales bacterium]
MRFTSIMVCGKLLMVIALASGLAGAVKAQSGFPLAAPNEAMFEFVGQSKNYPPAGPGLPATAVQYGYLSHIQGLNDDQIYFSGVPQNEASAYFTFYNDAITEKTTNHGSLRIVIREGTTTIYYNPAPDGDLTTPNPDSFRQGTPVLVTKWRHQVIVDTNPSPDPAAPPRTNLFFVTWWHTITSATPVQLGTHKVLLGLVGGRFMQHLVGGVDYTGTVNGKFAGYASSLVPVLIFPN